MKRLLFLLIVAVVTGLAIPATADAPITDTNIQHDLVESFVDVVPTCDFSGALYQITTTTTLVEHQTLFSDGRVHSTFTQTGTFVAEPLDPADEGGSGHFAIWGGFNLNGTTVNGTFTFNLNGEFDDGTKISFHAVDHFNVTPSGTEFFFTHCHD